MSEQLPFPLVSMAQCIKCKGNASLQLRKQKYSFYPPSTPDLEVSIYARALFTLAPWVSGFPPSTPFAAEGLFGITNTIRRHVEVLAIL